MKREYEAVVHDGSHQMEVSLMQFRHRALHLHRDFELGLVVEGETELCIGEQTYQAKQGDSFLINPYAWHELKAGEGARVLFVQVSPDFFKESFPEIREIEVATRLLSHPKIEEDLLQLADAYFKKERLYKIRCSALLNDIFYQILTECGFGEAPEKIIEKKEYRIRNIMDYIDRNYAKKILLSEIAQRENLTVCYLSHFFKECFGVTFQEYLQKIRCEKAVQLLTTTRMSVLDISMDCGFSDPKYLNRAMQKFYAMTPGQLREKNMEEILPLKDHKSQEVLSSGESLQVLSHTRNHLR